MSVVEAVEVGGRVSDDVAKRLGGEVQALLVGRVVGLALGWRLRRVVAQSGRHGLAMGGGEGAALLRRVVKRLVGCEQVGETVEELGVGHGNLGQDLVLGDEDGSQLARRGLAHLDEAAHVGHTSRLVGARQGQLEGRRRGMDRRRVRQNGRADARPIQARETGERSIDGANGRTGRLCDRPRHQKVVVAKGGVLQVEGVNRLVEQRVGVETDIAVQPRAPELQQHLFGFDETGDDDLGLGKGNDGRRRDRVAARILGAAKAVGGRLVLDLDGRHVDKLRLEVEVLDHAPWQRFEHCLLRQRPCLDGGQVAQQRLT